MLVKIKNLETLKNEGWSFEYGELVHPKYDLLFTQYMIDNIIGNEVEVFSEDKEGKMKLITNSNFRIWFNDEMIEKYIQKA
jgi:hypothetical protein